MIIHIPIGGVEHKYVVPIYEFTIKIPRPGPGPINYPPFLADATLLASLEDATNKISDGGVREAARAGIVAAVEALAKRAGVMVSLGEAGGAAGSAG